MAIIKCKMCGGDLRLSPESLIAECEYCGTTQTVPRIDNDRKANLYDRANHFRRSNDFDKAMSIYEQILNEDTTDAESYWSLVLCRYGIEYVEDPGTHKRIPTINRAQFTSIFDDEDYKSAIKNASISQRRIYETEAKAINEIHKGILSISQNEEPFDVFICYKETDANGRRTQDSVLAQDLYYQLTQEGFKVFFSRITLEDKLGTAYEPYIFAALNSAKVMVVLGTKPEHFNAVWVKNEWSRYLALIKNGAKKILVPAYRDMNPYDLPEEFSHLQAQDMSKLGFMQDLVRGIKKIAKADEPKPTTVVKETIVSGNNASTAPLLKRVFMFLEDGDWNSADEYCEKVLDINPETAEAYLGKLMVELKVRTQERLKDLPEPFDKQNNYQKAIRFADNELKNTLVGYIKHINNRNEKARIAKENARLEGIYNQATAAMQKATGEDSYKNAAELFGSIIEYKDSANLKNACLEKAETSRKKSLLDRAKKLMAHNDISLCEEALKKLRTIRGFENADELIVLCEQKLQKLKDEAETMRLELERQRLEDERKAELRRQEELKKAKRSRTITAIVFLCVFAAFVVLGYCLIQYFTVVVPENKYNDAIALMESGNYSEAISKFEKLDDYKDSASKLKECKYGYAIASIENGKFIDAYETLIALGSYKDCGEKADSIYEEYKIEKIKVAQAGDYITFGTYEQDNNLTNGEEEIEWLVLEAQGDRVLVISKYALDCQRYMTSNDKVTWTNSSIRQWLNNDFLNAAFSDEDREMIPTATVSSETMPETNDKVFLLSGSEVEKYFTSRESRKCLPTDYAIAHGADKLLESSYWWLRSDTNLYTAYLVLTDGTVKHSGGWSATEDNVAVRPAMWIEWES